MIRISKLLITNCLLIIFPIFSSAFAQIVTVTGTDLSPTFSPGTSTPIVSLSFVIVNTPMIRDIKVDRTGSATNTDVPTAKLWRDLNKDDVVNGSDVQLGDTAWFQGTGTQSVLFPFVNYFPSTSENLLIVYDVAFGASTSNTAGAEMPAGYITGGNLTTVVFTGITTGNQPLPVELVSFTASAQNKIVNLKWSTATEINNYGFEIERSQTSKVKSEEGTSLLLSASWETLGFVQGHGNSNSPKSYTFTDNLALARLTARQAHNLNLDRLQYRLKQIDFDGSYKYSDIIELQIDPPSELVLQQNYPNPFNPSTTIRYEIPKSTFVILSIFDLLGREITTLINQVQNAGYHEITFNAKKLSSGIYIYQIKAGEFSQIRKMLLMK